MTVGSSPYRIDAPGKVTGATLFPGDLTPDNLLHGKVLFSNEPHARLLAIDTSAAAAVPGVIAIFTAADVPVNEYGLVIRDQPVLVGPGTTVPHGDISLWEGDQVAIIVAESEEAAAAARALIQCTWERFPLVVDVAEARRDEVILHRAHGSNILRHYKVRKGDMAAGWAAADVVVEGTYRVPHQEHAFLQPEAALSYIDDAGRVTVEIAGQWVHEDQEQIAHALGLPLDQVRIIYPAVGGAFGGREDMSLQIVMALASWRLTQRGEHRPLRVIWSREESIIGHHKRHQMTIHTRWGATREGLLTAVEAELLMDAGAYNYTSNKVLGNAHLSAPGPYRVPNAQVDSYAIYTNNVPGGAFRGFGAPQGAFAAEAQMNKLAAALGIDPLLIRQRNALRDGDEGITMTTMPPGVSLLTVLQRLGDAAAWDQPLRPAGSDRLFKSFQSLPPAAGAVRRGRGVACAYKNIGFSFGFPERCEATIELYGRREIERVVLRHAGAEVGQGAHTAFRQMAAEATGVPYERIELVLADTAETGDSGSASASRMTWMAGNAIIGAAQRALAAWSDEDRPAVGHFRFVPRATEMMDPETGRSDPNITYGYVAEVAEVAVDTESGHLQVERVICAVDVGRAINPLLVVGQVEGAVVQAHGYAVTENLQVKEGRILNPRLSTYLIPGIGDVPVVVESVIVEEPDPQGPWGARGMAEMPFIPLAPAVAAALHDATGVWFDQLPLTPGRVVETLRG